MGIKKDPSKLDGPYFHNLDFAGREINHPLDRNRLGALYILSGRSLSALADVRVDTPTEDEA